MVYCEAAFHSELFRRTRPILWLSLVLKIGTSGGVPSPSHPHSGRSANPFLLLAHVNLAS